MARVLHQFLVTMANFGGVSAGDIGYEDDTLPEIVALTANGLTKKNGVTGTPRHAYANNQPLPSSDRHSS